MSRVDIRKTKRFYQMKLEYLAQNLRSTLDIFVVLAKLSAGLNYKV